MSEAMAKRSSAIASLSRCFGWVVFCLTFLAWRRISFWVLGSFFLLLVFPILIFFLFQFHHCLRHNPDALRSEQYHLKRMQIERELVGDRVTKELEITENDEVAQQPCETATKRKAKTA